MSVLLKGEEIKLVIKPKPVITDSDRRLIKAQAKKLVEWLEAEMETAPLGLRLARFEKCLEDLKKEVEDG